MASPASSTPPIPPASASCSTSSTTTSGRRAARTAASPRYLTDEYRTPWGDAVNVAGAGSDLVRRTFIESACRWIEDFHVDGLRLDAVQAIVDPTATPFLEELAAAVHAAGAASGRTVLVIAESSANDPRLVRSPDAGGIGCDAVWNDDVHHAIRVALTGDRRGYYVDYDGVADLAEALDRRWVFNGRRSHYRGRRHGRPVGDIPHERFVVFTSNHDHVGNTPAGARPPYDHRRRLVAAAAVLLSPFTPLLFMGEEYGETAPFPFFVDHGDADLLEATRTGRQEEFAAAEWTDEVLDPADPATFEAAVLDPSLADQPEHAEVLAAYTELIALRRHHPVVHAPDAEQSVSRVGDAVVVTRHRADASSVLAVNLGESAVELDVGPGLAVAFDCGGVELDGWQAPSARADRRAPRQRRRALIWARIVSDSETDRAQRRIAPRWKVNGGAARSPGRLPARCRHRARPTHPAHRRRARGATRPVAARWSGRPGSRRPAARS